MRQIQEEKKKELHLHYTKANEFSFEPTRLMQKLKKKLLQIDVFPCFTSKMS